jgi:Ni/Co efflux regulator RcnB
MLIPSLSGSRCLTDVQPFLPERELTGSFRHRSAESYDSGAAMSDPTFCFEEILMKRILAAALAVTLMTGSVLVEARDHDGRDSRSRHDERTTKGKHARHAGSHHERRERYAHNRHHHDHHWEGRDYRGAHAVIHQRRFHAGHYYRPVGYRHYAWHRGAHLPAAYYAPRYVVYDYDAYHLHRPPHGHHWVRVDGDVLLTAIATGVVVAVVSDLFY